MTERVICVIITKACLSLFYTQLSSGSGLCKICVMLQACLLHGNLRNAAFVKKNMNCLDDLSLGHS